MISKPWPQRALAKKIEAMPMQPIRKLSGERSGQSFRRRQRAPRPIAAATRRLALIVPVYNEAAVLPQFLTRAAGALAGLPYDWRITFVDDGSSDGSARLLAGFAAADPRHVRVLTLSRNFGQQLAISAGLEHTRADALIISDADLQDPPELIPALVAQWEQGYEVVHAVRSGRQGESWFKRLSAAAFYKLMRRLAGVELPENSGDFKLIDRQVARTLRRMPEPHRFLRGMIAWVGFRQARVDFVRPPRQAGETKYPLGKMLHLAMDSAVSFSILPLRLATLTGAAAGLASLATLAWVLVARLAWRATIPGWASLMTIVLLLGGVQLLTVGILGEYLGRAFQQGKQRPLYVLRRRG